MFNCSEKKYILDNSKVLWLFWVYTNIWVNNFPSCLWDLWRAEMILLRARLGLRKFLLPKGQACSLLWTEAIIKLVMLCINSVSGLYCETWKLWCWRKKNILSINAKIFSNMNPATELDVNMDQKLNIQWTVFIMHNGSIQ